MGVESQPRTRRAVLAAAIGTAAGAVAMELGRPMAADAAPAPLEMSTDNTADATTRLAGPAGVVFSVATKTMPAFEEGAEVVAIGSDVMGDPALNIASVNQNGALGIRVSVPGNGELLDSTGILIAAGAVGVRAEQQNESGAGVTGIANGSQAAGVEGGGQGYYAVGVAGWSTGVAGIAVNGSAAGTGTGGVFKSEKGTALEVKGPARFSRSGRVLVPAGRSFADITVPGGLSTSKSVVIATIQTYRPGVAIAGVRLNYPSTGKARIYLTKVASTAATTPVGWLVLD
jgi:hypothetical protein